jgi:hypothetical protein
MKTSSIRYGHSALVQLHLKVGAEILELAAVGPLGVRLREPTAFPPGEAEVVMNVDDFESRWPVYLPDGISANSRDLRTVPAAQASS